MKFWQVAVIALLMAVCGWLVASHLPAQSVVEQSATPSATDNAIPSPTPHTATLLFAGDIMLSRSVGATMAAHRDWVWPFANIASVTVAADLAFANLETTVSQRGAAAGCGYCFRSDPRAMEGLVAAGFDVLSVANNHIWDYGLPAFTDTLAYLAASDISAVGGGRTLEEARAPVVRMAGDARVAYLAYTDILPASAAATADRAGANLFDPVRMTDDVAHARAVADLVVVSFHTGTEYEPGHTKIQEQMFHDAVDAGADLVIGTHPHVVEDIEQYGRGWIAYSLGNFVFDQTFSPATEHGSLLRVTLQGTHIVDVHSIPVVISNQYQVSVQK